jgi:hypothetical protein
MGLISLWQQRFILIRKEARCEREKLVFNEEKGGLSREK